MRRTSFIFPVLALAMLTFSGQRVAVAEKCDSCEGMKYQEAGDYAHALSIYETCANAGDIGCLQNMGWMYEHGLGVDTDYRVAMSYYTRAAEGGQVEAINNIGYMYQHGMGVPQDNDTALSWYQRSAAMGYQKSAEHIREIQVERAMAARMPPAGAAPGAVPAGGPPRGAAPNGVSAPGGSTSPLWEPPQPVEGQSTDAPPENNPPAAEQPAPAPPPAGCAGCMAPPPPKE